MQYSTSRQVATGLIVNKKINVKHEYYKTLRAQCHSLFQRDKYILSNGEEGNIRNLDGMLSFTYQIKRRYDKELADTRKSKPNAITKLYRSFLFYKHFFDIKKPLIICEGKTDIIYLKCAIKSLHSDFENLCDFQKNKISYKINFLRFSNRFKDVCAISEGTTAIHSLMLMYENYLNQFKGNGLKHPVIIILDTDKGSNTIKSLLDIKNYEKPFTEYKKNLYVVFVSNKKDIEIEDLFEKELLETIIDGKNFCKDKKHKDDSKYGKHVFAEKVIRPQQDIINFDGFKYLLNCIQGVIEDYKRKQKDN